MKYALWQNHGLIANHDEINALGWDKAAAKFPCVAAHLACSLKGSEGYKPGMLLNCYHIVAVIEADDLDHAFDVGNIGPESNIERWGRMHSMSVGDILSDADGNWWMVDSIGFGKLENI